MRQVRTTAAALVLVTLAGVPAVAGQSPASALDRLKAGNARFVSDPAIPLPGADRMRSPQAGEQSPFAIVLSCADARVPAEQIFNAGPGDLYVVRTAGGIADKTVLAGVEHAAEQLKAALLVVMGHETCDAVRSALESKPGAESGGPNRDALAAAIRPAFRRMSSPPDVEHLRDAILANVEQVVNDLLGRSAVVKRLAVAGQLQVIGAYYEPSTGRVRFSEPVRLQAEPPAGGGAGR